MGLFEKPVETGFKTTEEHEEERRGTIARVNCAWAVREWNKPIPSGRAVQPMLFELDETTTAFDPKNGQGELF